MTQSTKLRPAIRWSSPALARIGAALACLAATAAASTAGCQDDGTTPSAEFPGAAFDGAAGDAPVVGDADTARPRDAIAADAEPLADAAADTESPADSAADDGSAEADADAAPVLETLDVTVSGAGGVTDDAALIACGTAGANCAASFAQGTPVTLTATPDAGHRFAGWSGDCSGTGTCVISMDGAHAVTAQFVVTKYPLDVTVAGTGSGTVTGGPIDCGAGATLCSANLAVDTPITLTAAATGNTNVFAGWTGACSGKQATCMVTMTQAQSVTATFVANTLTLQVGGYGSLSGGGLTAGRGQTLSTAPKPIGTKVTVTAQFVPNWFVSWGADCSSNGAQNVSCTLTLDGPKTASAQFFDNGNGCVALMDPTSSAPCTTAGNFDCCYRSDGASPYDFDGDGYLACDSPCGAAIDRCYSGTSFDTPCDCNDHDRNVHPGAGCSTCSPSVRFACDCSGSCP